MADRKRTDVDWENVRIFLALARHGSLSAAARALSVNHATVARRLHSLEESLAEQLVERRPEGYVLTAAGTRAVEVASDMEGAAQTLLRGLGATGPSGLVRINASPALAAGYLTARLAGIAARHTMLDIDLATNLRSISLERHEADIAIRFDRPEDGDVIARPLASVSYGYYGTEAACRRMEMGAEPVFVGFGEADAFLREAGWLARHFPRSRVAFRANNHFAQAVAARSGIGIALVPHYIGRTTPELRPVALDPVPPARDIYLVIRRRDRTNFAISAVANDIAEQFEADGALFG